MCFVLKRAGSQCIEMVLCTVDQLAGAHGARLALVSEARRLFGRLDICLTVQDGTMEGGGARVRQFAVYDANLEFFQFWKLLSFS